MEQNNGCCNVMQPMDIHLAGLQGSWTTNFSSLLKLRGYACHMAQSSNK